MHLWTFLMFRKSVPTHRLYGISFTINILYFKIIYQIKPWILILLAYTLHNAKLTQTGHTSQVGDRAAMRGSNVLVLRGDRLFAFVRSRPCESLWGRGSSFISRPRAPSRVPFILRPRPRSWWPFLFCFVFFFQSLASLSRKSKGCGTLDTHESPHHASLALLLLFPTLILLQDTQRRSVHYSSCISDDDRRFFEQWRCTNSRSGASTLRICFVLKLLFFWALLFFLVVLRRVIKKR